MERQTHTAHVLDMLLQHPKTAEPSAGSVGAHWPPRHDARNSRIKGFAPYLLDSDEALTRFSHDVAAARRMEPAATRTTVRALVRSSMIEDGTIRRLNLDAEAVVPAGNFRSGYDLVYFAQNSEARAQSPDIIRAEMEAVQRVNAINQVDPERVFTRLNEGGYQLSVLREATERHIQTLQALYTEAYSEYTFVLSRDTLTRMVESPDNSFIVAAGPDGAIVSAMAAEHARLSLMDGKLDLFELSDYATFKAHRGQGLMTAMQVFAADHLRRLPGGERAIIFAEDRAAWTPAFISSRKAGLCYAGTLFQHCRLVSDRDIGALGNLEDLNVFAVPPSGGRLDIPHLAPGTSN